MEQKICSGISNQLYLIGIIKYHFSCMNHLYNINDYEINVSYNVFFLQNNVK